MPPIWPPAKPPLPPVKPDEPNCCSCGVNESFDGICWPATRRPTTSLTSAYLSRTTSLLSFPGGGVATGVGIAGGANAGAGAAPAVLAAIVTSSVWPAPGATVIFAGPDSWNVTLRLSPKLSTVIDLSGSRPITVVRRRDAAGRALQDKRDIGCVVAEHSCMSEARL